MAAACLVAGCGPGGIGIGGSAGEIQIRYTQGAQREIPASIRKIAVAEFTAASAGEKRYGDYASDKLAADLDRYNQTSNRYKLVDRKRLKQIMDEKDLQLAISDASAATKVGKIADVQAMIYGNVKVRSQDIQSTKSVPKAGGRFGVTMEQLPYTRRTVTVTVSFSMDNVATSETLATATPTEVYDSEKDNKKPGFAGALKSLGMGSDDSLPTEQATNVLIEKCVQQFVSMISPHEVSVTQPLAKGKSPAVAKGNKLAVAGEMDAALDEYKAALAETPDDDAAAYNAGLVCESQGKFKEALEFYGKAIRANPDNANAIHGRDRVKPSVAPANDK